MPSFIPTSRTRPASNAARLTRTAGWGFAALCAIAFCISTRWYVVYRFHRDTTVQPTPVGPAWAPDFISVGWGLSGGAFRTMRWYGRGQYAVPPPAGWFSGHYDGPLILWPSGFDYPLRQRAYPLWMIALAGFGPRALVASRDCLRRLRGRCHVCAYDVRTLPRTGVFRCPECGAPVMLRSAEPGKPP